MIALAWIFLLAATKVDLVDEVYQIPPAEWRYVELDLRQNPAYVWASYEVQSGSRHVRLALMTRGDLEHLRAGAPHGVIAVTAPGTSGNLAYRVRRRGDYVMFVDNRADGREAAAVHLRIALDFALRTDSEITQISPQRQLTVVLMSFAFFAAVVTYSGWKLWTAIRR